MPFLGLPDPLWELLSYLGLLLLLGAFALHSLGKLPRGPAYFAMNAAGGIVLAFFSYKLGSLALTALEGAWAAIALGGWARMPKAQ